MGTHRSFARSRKVRVWGRSATSPSNMGRSFGNLGIRVRGTVSYTLSPYEQKAFAGAFSKGIPNMIRRFSRKVGLVATPMVLTYLYYDYINKTAIAMNRKDPAEFKDDE